MSTVQAEPQFARHLQQRRDSAARHARRRVFLIGSGLWMLALAGLAALDSANEPATGSLQSATILLWILLLSTLIWAGRAAQRDRALVLERIEAARPETGQLFTTASWTLESAESGLLAGEVRAQAVRELEQTPAHAGHDPRGSGLPALLALVGAAALAAFLLLADQPRKTLKRVLFFDSAPYTQLAFEKLPTELLANQPVSGEIVLRGRARAEVRLSTRVNGGAADERVLPVRDGRALIALESPGGDLELTARAGDAPAVQALIPFVRPPRLSRPRLRVIPPAYTLQAEQTVNDPTLLEVLEGSTVVFSAACDPVPDPARFGLTGRTSGSCEGDGRAKWEGVIPTIRALVKLGPGDMTLQAVSERQMFSNLLKVALTGMPDEMPEASVDGEETDAGVKLRGALTDDVGLGKTGMFMVVNGQEVELKAKDVAGKAKGTVLEAEVTREQLQVSDEETVAVFSWAEDLAPQHAGQRTVSDPLLIVVPKNGEPPKPQKPQKPQKQPKKLELKKAVEKLAKEAKALAEMEGAIADETAKAASDLEATTARQAQAASRLEKLRGELGELFPGSPELGEAAEAAAKAIAASSRALQGKNAPAASKPANEAAGLLNELAKALTAQSGTPEEQAEAAAEQAMEAAEALEGTPSASKSSAASRAAAALGRAAGSPKASELSDKLTKAAAQPDGPKAEGERKELAKELKEEARKTLAKAAEEKLKQEAATQKANELAKELMKDAMNNPRQPGQQPGQKPGEQQPGQKPGEPGGQKPDPNDAPPPGQEPQGPESDQESEGQGTQKGKSKSLAKALGQSGSAGLVQEAESMEAGFKRGEVPDYRQLSKIVRMTEERLSQLAAERKRRLSGKEAAGSGAELTRKYLQGLSDDATPGEGRRE